MGCMLIIGHRGAAGLAPENSLDALRAGVDAGADILEFDIRLTKDAVPVLAHNPMVSGQWVSRHTLAELRHKTPITTLQEVLDEFFGKILLNIELKQVSSTAPVYDMVSLYVSRDEEWDNILFSSFKPRALKALRNRSDTLNLALLHHVNPYAFMRVHRQLHLSAVGFHRLHASTLAIAVAKELGLFTYVYTVDRPEAALRFNKKDVGGIVTNVPDVIAAMFQAEA